VEIYLESKKTMKYSSAGLAFIGNSWRCALWSERKVDQMREDIYKSIKEQSESYKYYSLKYTEYEDVQGYDVICWDGQLILLLGYNEEDRIYEYHWAANDVSFLLKEIKKQDKKGLITFVPPEWIDELKDNGFVMYAVWNDYFNNDISINIEPAESIEILKACDYKEASDVTISCRDQSRGFSGQSETWMKVWIEGSEPNLAAMKGKDSAVLVHREKDYIAGIICVAVYGHESEKGPTLWVREIAVLPEYQGRGIAKKLLNQALFFGKKHGAKRSFLMADELNAHAIKIYEKMGFTANKAEAAHDMIQVNLQVGRINDNYKSYSKNPESFNHNTSYIITEGDGKVIASADFLIDSCRSAEIDPITIFERSGADSALMIKMFMEEFLYWNPFIEEIRYAMTDTGIDAAGLTANEFYALESNPKLFYKCNHSAAKAFKIDINRIQPSQLTINRNKLNRVSAWIKEPQDIVIPVIKLQNELVAVDGHTRLTKAVMNGFTHVFAYYEPEGCDEEMYRTFVGWCKEKNINDSADLVNRIVSEEEHNVEWIERCQRYIRNRK
jgi:ribosomal protein S18 acetylase RimI-like enzyme